MADGRVVVPAPGAACRAVPVEGAWGGGTDEAVDVDLLDRALRFVGDRRRGAHHDWADAPDAQVVGDLVGGPAASWIGGGVDHQGRAQGVASTITVAVAP